MPSGSVWLKLGRLLLFKQRTLAIQILAQRSIQYVVVQIIVLFVNAFQAIMEIQPVADVMQNVQLVPIALAIKLALTINVLIRVQMFVDILVSRSSL